MFFRLHIASGLRSDCNICRVGLSPGFPGRCLVLEVVGAPGGLGVQFQCQLHPFALMLKNESCAGSLAA